MKVKSIVVALGVLAWAGISLAQTAAATNTHRSYDQRARECRKQAADQQLKGEEARQFIAQCMKG